MYAIIVTGGKQYKVEVGSEIMVEKLDEQIGANVNFDVLMMADGELLNMAISDGAKITKTIPMSSASATPETSPNAVPFFTLSYCFAPRF